MGKVNHSANSHVSRIQLLQLQVVYNSAPSCLNHFWQDCKLTAQHIKALFIFMFVCSFAVLLITSNHETKFWEKTLCKK